MVISLVSYLKAATPSINDESFRFIVGCLRESEISNAASKHDVKALYDYLSTQGMSEEQSDDFIFECYKRL